MKKNELQVVEQQVQQEIQNPPPEKQKKNRTPFYKTKWFKLLISIFCFILITISLVRVPLVGAFIDATIFSILFGYTKYIAYFILYVSVIWFWIPKHKRPKISFKIVTFLCFIWLLISIIISAVCVQIDYSPFKNEYVNFTDFFIGKPNSYFEYWKNNDWASIIDVQKTWFYLNPKSYGGILSFLLVVLFESLSAIVLAIITSFLLIYALYLFISKKVRLYKNTSNKKIIEEKEEDIHPIKNNNLRTYLTKLKKENSNLPIKDVNFLSNTAIDNKAILESELKNFIKRIKSIFEQINIKKYEIIQTEVMFKSITLEVLFSKKIDKQNLEKNLQNEFMGNDVYYYFGNNKLYISKKIDVDQIISFKEMIENIAENYNYELSLGKTSDRNFVKFNALQANNTILFGTKGSGLTAMLSNLTLLLASLNSKDILNIYIMDATNKSLKSISTLPQIIKYSIDESSVLENLNQIVEIIQHRKKLINDNKCLDIYSYIDTVKNAEPIPACLLVINALDEVRLWEQRISFDEKLKFILDNAYKTKIIVLVSSDIVNEYTTSINMHFNNIVVLKTESANDSKTILGDESAYYLWGNGDALLKTKNKTIHFQSFFANKEETNQIVDYISK